MYTFKTRLLSIFFLASLLVTLPASRVRAISITYRVTPTGLTSGSCGGSWANACSLQHALKDLAAANDMIWVAAGTYLPTIGIDETNTNRSLSFTLRGDIAVYGGFAGTETDVIERNPAVNITILSGNIGNPDVSTDNSYHVVVGNNGGHAKLDGFTITGGNADGSWPDSVGGGLVYRTGATLDLTHIVFNSNSAGTSGGGVFSSYGNLTLENVTFESNTSASTGGGMVNTGGNPILNNVIFESNTSGSGGGMAIGGDHPVLTNVVFKDNTASGGGAIQNNATVTISNSTFINNDVTAYGGAIYNSGTATISNSTFYENDTNNSGGAIYNSTTLTVSYSTFSHNGAAIRGAGIYNDYGTLNLKNSILANSKSGEDCYHISGGLSANHNLIETNAGGSNACGSALAGDPNLGPLQDNGGFTQTMALLPGSVSIDAADEASCPDTDQRGVTRPRGSYCDIGAFEFSSSTPYPLAPANGDVLLHKRPTFRWWNGTGATVYKIHVSRSSTFATLDINVIVTDSTYTPDVDLSANKPYYWRVRAKVDGVWSPWSETWSFTTAKPPSVPVLVAPANKALTKDYKPLLDWKNSTIPSGGAAFDHYQVQVSVDKAFSDPLLIDASDVTISSYTPATDLAANTKYYWRVRSFNVDGQYSSWSTIWSFSTALLPPGNLTPTDGESVPTRKPLLDWDPVAGASGYSIQISTSSSFSTLLVNTPVTADTFTPSTKLPANTLLYWRVRATGTNGPSRWTTASFHTP